MNATVTCELKPSQDIAALKFKNKFDCLVHEMLFIMQLKSNLNVQSQGRIQGGG